MERQLHRASSNVLFEDYQPGCLWSLLHILDHHHKKNARKMVPHKKGNGRRYNKCCGNPKTFSMDRDAFEARSLFDAEAENFLVEQNPIGVSPIDKRIKALVTEEMSEEENHCHWVLGFSSEPKIQLTNSVHHLEPSAYNLGKISTDWASPIIILHKNANTSAREVQFSALKKTNRSLVSRNTVCDRVKVEASFGPYHHCGKYPQVQSDKTMGTSKNQAKELDRENFHHQVKEHVDVSDMVNVKEELFFNVMQIQDIAASKHIPGLQFSNKKAKLTKSGSFPGADTSRVYLRPSTLAHKQNEIWIIPKREKLVSITQPTKPDAVRPHGCYNENTRPSLADEAVDGAKKRDTSTSSWGSLRVSHHQSWNKLVIGRLRGIKQRIKHVIKDSKKDRGKANTNGFLQRVPSTSPPSLDGKDMPKSLESISNSQGVSYSFISKYEIDGSAYDLCKSEICCMRRTASLNESIGRYARLFDSSFNWEAKLPLSKSLRLRNEDKFSSKDHTPKFLRRISSLSDVESFYSLVNEVVQDSDKAVRSEVDCNTNAGSYTRSETKSSSLAIDIEKFQAQDAVVETEFPKNTKEGRSGGEGLDRTDEPAENIVEPAKFKSLPRKDQEIDMAMNLTEGVAQPSLVSEPEFMATAKCLISEGSESNPLSIHIEEADSSNVMQNGTREDPLPSLCSKMNHENDTHFLHFELDNDEASFSYVRDILQLSGFTGNDSLGKWYSLEQPLDPSLFKEMEADLHHHVNYSEVLSGNCDHQLLFDFINEVLLKMYDETSFTYFPRGFSFNPHIRPMPKGHRVLNEIWSRICWYLSYTSDLDRTLNDVVSQDMAKKSDSWMNLQFETECAALELQDLIFDELLEEAICL